LSGGEVLTAVVDRQNSFLKEGSSESVQIRRAGNSQWEVCPCGLARGRICIVVVESGIRKGDLSSGATGNALAQSKSDGSIGFDVVLMHGIVWIDVKLCKRVLRQSKSTGELIAHVLRQPQRGDGRVDHCEEAIVNEGLRIAATSRIFDVLNADDQVVEVVTIDRNRKTWIVESAGIVATKRQTCICFPAFMKLANAGLVIF